MVVSAVQAVKRVALLSPLAAFPRPSLPVRVRVRVPARAQARLRAPASS